MPLIKCPACAKEISDQALACPQCGQPMKMTQNIAQVGPAMAAVSMRYLGGIEYRSKTSIMGLPLIHIATGFDASTGRKRIARGVIAIGDVAIGVFALGGLSLGGICIGGLAIGLASLGGLAIGAAVAVGGGAIGYFALGGGAVGYYAIGGAAFGAHTLSAISQDPELMELLKQYGVIPKSFSLFPSGFKP